MGSIEDRRLASQRREAALHARVEQEQTRFESTFGSDESWTGAEISDNGSLELHIYRYTDFKGDVSMSREEAIRLRDYLNENIK